MRCPTCNSADRDIRKDVFTRNEHSGYAAWHWCADPWHEGAEGAPAGHPYTQRLNGINGINNPKPATRNREALASFVAYCESHTDERFWQALRNWSKWHFIIGRDSLSENEVDTFHLEGLEGTRDDKS